jgi:hypothetical protein
MISEFVGDMFGVLRIHTYQHNKYANFKKSLLGPHPPS